jgi:hypothetical protein
MPDVHKPCSCSKCKGTIVSAQTARNHAFNIASSSILPFSTWSDLCNDSTATAVIDNMDSRACRPSMEPSTNRPSKRHCYTMVSAKFLYVTSTTILSHYICINKVKMIAKLC